MEGPVEGRFRWSALVLPATVIASVLLIYLPLPARYLDLFLAANLGLSLLILLTAIFVRTPLEFSIFPALLLVATMARISLNVATTRLILSRGPIDHELAAGQVVAAFGRFVAADQLAVGLVIFLILFLVQFIVVTRGASRIGEVAARFALDALPGRQQAIDADLAAGVINHEKAQAMRRRLLDGADFYGSMDGAGKYIRGEAVAGLCITAINLVAGIGLGLAGGLGLQDALRTFSLLTIGDGLASQLPALLTSLAAGILVSRGSAPANLPESSWAQVTGHPMALAFTAGLLVVLAFANLPTIPLLALAGGAGLLAWRGLTGAGRDSSAAAKPDAARPSEASLERLLEAHALQVQLGSGLLGLSDAAQGGDLLARISGLRANLASRMGTILPKVRVRDRLDLRPDEFQILVHDEPVILARIPAHSLLHTGPVPVGQEGAPLATDLPWAGQATWIGRELAPAFNQGENLPPAAVIVRSLEWAAVEHARELLDLDSLRQLLDETRKHHPAIVESVTVARPQLLDLLGILRSLVAEQVPLRPLHRILEAVHEAWSAGLNGPDVVEAVRQRLGRVLCQSVELREGMLPCFGLSPELEQKLSDSRKRGLGPREALPESVRASLLRSIETGVQHMKSAGMKPVMVVRQDIRPLLVGILGRLRPSLLVLGDSELGETVAPDVIARIRLGEIQSQAA